MFRDVRSVEVVPISHPKGCRSYVVIDPESKEALVVDPLLDHLPDTLKALAEGSATLRWIVDTHSHADHLSGAAALAAKVGGAVVMHPAAPSEVATVRPADGELLPFGDHGIKVHHAPGNTPDSIVVEVGGAFFTGDTLLIGTVGLMDAPGSDADVWFDTLHRIFDGLPDATVIHPGHDDMGRTMTTMKDQRRGNRWLRIDDREAFRGMFGSDARAVRKDAPTLLESNRVGLHEVPRDLESASGLIDPARATEEKVRAASRRPEPTASDLAPPVPSSARWTMLAAGLATILGSAFGFLLNPLFHALSAGAGAVLVGASLSSGGKGRKKGDSTPLYYTGPVRRTPTR